ncbi:flagellar basal body-associated protein FliL [Paracoccus sp. p4-l81]|uniref:flagellar basal body-associated FliL family protein n=1 Tax=unclassified Paracoccus (in: a-proteobacteria) TaxID=2688777 RepID=UPI0035BB5C20
MNVIIVLVLAGAGFAVTYLGLLQGLVGGSGQHESHDAAPAFVAIEPMAIVIPGTPPRQFRLSAQIEVAPDQIAAVQGMMPRVQNVLQGFLRAVEPDRLADRAAWFELRLQMLYRIRMVLGEDRVRDLLITDFIVN